jgi:hypothetical protein
VSVRGATTSLCERFSVCGGMVLEETSSRRTTDGTPLKHRRVFLGAETVLTSSRRNNCCLQCVSSSARGTSIHRASSKRRGGFPLSSKAAPISREAYRAAMSQERGPYRSSRFRAPDGKMSICRVPGDISPTHAVFCKRAKGEGWFLSKAYHTQEDAIAAISPAWISDVDYVIVEREPI